MDQSLGGGFHTQMASDPNSPCASGAKAQRSPGLAQVDCWEGEVATEPACVHFSASVLAGQLQGRPSDSAASNLTSGFKCGGKGLLRG